jgi:hypothetical protein
LEKLYLGQASRQIEIVLVSRDMVVDEAASYRAKMPWLSLPLEDTSALDQISDDLGVRSIPHLMGFDADGAQIAFNLYPDGLKNLPW